MENKMYCLDLAAKRLTDNPVCWIVGCSISHGVGVTSAQRYGEQVSNAFKLDSRYLTHPGSSIEWAADQILRSDIRSGDMLVWGVTHIGRFCYYDDDGIKNGITAYYYKERNPKFNQIINQNRLVDNNIAFKAVDYIYQVKNFLDKINNVDYRFLWLFQDLEHLRSIFLPRVQSIPQFVVGFDQLQEKWIDLGTDNAHPGPAQHRAFADKVIESFNTIK